MRRYKILPSDSPSTVLPYDNFFAILQVAGNVYHVTDRYTTHGKIAEWNMQIVKGSKTMNEETAP